MAVTVLDQDKKGPSSQNRKLVWSYMLQQGAAGSRGLLVECLDSKTPFPAGRHT